MADSKGTPKETRSDRGAGPPIERPQVDVEVTPREGVKSGDPHVQKVKESLGGQTRRAIHINKDGGSDAQLDAARKVVKEATEQAINPAIVEKVKVTVSGEIDGEEMKPVPIVAPIPVPKKTDAAGPPLPDAAPPTKPSGPQRPNKSDKRRRN